MYTAARSAIALLTAREKAVYAGLVAARMLVGVLDVLGVLLVGVIAALGATQLASSDGGYRFLGFELPLLDSTQLLLLVLFVLFVFVFKAFLAIFLSRLLTSFVARVEARNTAALAHHLLDGTLEDVRRLSKAEFQFVLTESTKWTFTGLLNNVASIFVEGFLLLLVASAFFIVDPVVALFAVGYFALIVIGMQAGIARILRRAGEDAAASTVDTVGLVSDTVDSFREITVLGRSELYLKRLDQSRTRLARSGATLAFLGGMPRYVVETALILGVVVFVGQQVFTDQLASGLATLGVFLGGAVRIMGAILPLQTAVAALKVNTEQSARARALLAQIRIRRRHVEPPRHPVASTGEGPLGVEVTDMSYRYPGDHAPTLDRINLSIEPGQFIALIGPSGAGKSTLVEAILGLTTPSWGGVSIGGLDPLELRRLAPGDVSYVPQHPGLVGGTIAENVAIGVASELIDRERVQEVLRIAQLEDFVNGLPDGMDASVGANADAFSGGQIQRIGLARALYVRPRLLALDEATSALDAATEAVISRSLQDLRGTTTLLVIAHRLSTVQHADKVYVLEGGRISASGDFSTLRRNVPMVAEYVKLMSFDDPDERPAAEPGEQLRPARAVSPSRQRGRPVSRG